MDRGPERPSLQLLRILAAARQPAEGKAPRLRDGGFIMEMAIESIEMVIYPLKMDKHGDFPW